jgi:hypothetical protein
VAASLGRGGMAVPRAILEGFAAEAHRQGLLTAMQVRLLLSHESRWETQEFLASRDALRSLSAEEILQDADTAFTARVAS